VKRYAPYVLSTLTLLAALSGCLSKAPVILPYPNRPAQLKCVLPCDLPRPAYHKVEIEVDRDHVYDLAELIDIAQRLNPNTRIAWEQAKQAAYAVGLAEANYLPQLSADIVSGYQVTPLPVPKIPAPIPLLPIDRFTLDTFECIPSLVIKWLLFDFGKRNCVVEAAKQLSYATLVAFTEMHQKLIYDVSKAYFDLSAKREQLHAAEDTLEKAETLQNVAEAKLGRGLATTTEVAIARQETAKALYNLEQARAEDNDAYHGLMEAIGLTPTLALHIADSSGRALPMGLAADVNSYICRALEQRPDIIEAFAKLRASAAEICSAEASYRPTIELDAFAYQNIGSLSINDGPTTWVNKPAAAFWFKFKLPLYDGGTRRNNLCIARSKNEAAKQELIKTQDAAIRQVAKTYDQVKSALAEYHSAIALVEASDIAFDSALASYHQGVGTFQNAVTAISDRSYAQYVLANAYATVLTAAAALAFSTGELTSIEPSITHRPINENLHSAN
jgi:outer membrane protein